MRYETLEGGQGVMAGHSLTWRYPFPAGLALCRDCGQLITARQLGMERCTGARPDAADGFTSSSAGAHT
jgi:hypothetical protein